MYNKRKIKSAQLFKPTANIGQDKLRRAPVDSYMNTTLLNRPYNHEAQPVFTEWASKEDRKKY